MAPRAVRSKGKRASSASAGRTSVFSSLPPDVLHQVLLKLESQTHR